MTHSFSPIPRSNHSWIFQKNTLLPLARNDFWKIESGVVRISTILEDGTLIVLGLLGPRDIIAASLIRLSCYQIDCLSVVRVIPFYPVEGDRFVEIATNYLQQLQELTVIRSHKTVDLMLIHLLHWLSRKFGCDTEQGRTIDLRITHQEFADILGTTRVTVTRILDRLERQKFIDRLPMQKLVVRSRLTSSSKQ